MGAIERLETDAMPFLRSTQEQLADFREVADNGVAMVHVDTCLSSYVQDHHNRDGECLFGVYVDGNSTVADVRQGLVDEVRQTGDRVPEEVTDEMIATAIAATFDGADPDALFDSSLEVPDEDSDGDGMESCQAWFVLTWTTQEED